MSDEIIKMLTERVELLERKVDGVHEVPVHVELHNEGSRLPMYAREGDAGMDLYADVDAFIPCGDRIIVSSGIKVAVPDGFELQVRSRSGIAAKTSLLVPNSPGTVDSGYRDIVGVILYNAEEDHGIIRQLDANSKLDNNKIEVAVDHRGGFMIHKGDRIAQIVLNKICKIKWIPVDDVKSIKGDRGGGFGHTGISEK